MQSQVITLFPECNSLGLKLFFKLHHHTTFFVHTQHTYKHSIQSSCLNIMLKVTDDKEKEPAHYVIILLCAR